MRPSPRLVSGLALSAAVWAALTLLAQPPRHVDDAVLLKPPAKVLLQAPKNGFYVIDRLSGELLSAQPYVTVTPATADGLQPDDRPGLLPRAGDQLSGSAPR